MFQLGQINGNNGGVAPVGAVQDNAPVNTTNLAQHLNVWVQTQSNRQDANTARVEFLRIAQNPTHTMLNLQGLQLSHLPDVFDLLPHLTDLNLSGNTVLDTTLPASLLAYENLRHLNLYDTPFNAEHVDTLRRNNSIKNSAIYTNKQATTFAALPAELKQEILLQAVKGMEGKDAGKRLGQLSGVNKDFKNNIQQVVRLPDLSHMGREKTKLAITALARQDLPLADYQRGLEDILRNNRDVSPK